MNTHKLCCFYRKLANIVPFSITNYPPDIRSTAVVVFKFRVLVGIQPVFYSDECLKRRRSSLKMLQKCLPKEHFSAEGFGLVMDAYTNTCVDAILNAFDLSCLKAAVDLGGKYASSVRF